MATAAETTKTAPAAEQPAVPATTTTATAAAAAAPPPEAKPDADKPVSPVEELSQRLPAIIKDAGHSEMWGVELKDLEHAPTHVILQKFLRANTGNLEQADKQLRDALAWRKEFKPLELADRTYSPEKFAGLGYVTTHDAGEGKQTAITWNIYGAVKDNKATFGDVDEFIRWRAALMELGVQKLKLNAISAPIPEGGEDPYQMVQVHDYLSVSFLRPDPLVKAASKKTISVFATAYPELVSHKFFVNVPALMGWMFSFMKLFVSAATVRKFHPMSSGAALAGELPDIAASLPQVYGGKGAPVSEGQTVKLGASADPPPPPPPPEDDKPDAEPEVSTAAAAIPEPAAGPAAEPEQKESGDAKVESVAKEETADPAPEPAAETEGAKDEQKKD